MTSVDLGGGGADNLEGLASSVLAHFHEHRPAPESFPMLATKVVDAAEQPEVNVGKLAHLIECDPAICAAVLAMANSSANRPVVAITDVRQAISRLGLRDVTNVAVGVACRSLFDMEVRVQNELFSAWWGRLFHAAMTEAFTCEHVARRHAPRAQGMFLAGLLHDVGKSLALRSLASLIVSGKVRPVEDEEQLGILLQANNAEIGAVALERFGMPEPVVESCRLQDHEPSREDPVECHVVRFVSRLNALRTAPSGEHEYLLPALWSAADHLSISTAGVLDLAKQLCERAVQARLLFSCGVPSDDEAFLQLLQGSVEAQSVG